MGQYKRTPHGHTIEGADTFGEQLATIDGVRKVKPANFRMRRIKPGPRDPKVIIDPENPRIIVTYKSGTAIQRFSVYAEQSVTLPALRDRIEGQLGADDSNGGGGDRPGDQVQIPERIRRLQEAAMTPGKPTPAPPVSGTPTPAVAPTVSASPEVAILVGLLPERLRRTFRLTLQVDQVYRGLLRSAKRVSAVELELENASGTAARLFGKKGLVGFTRLRAHGILEVKREITPRRKVFRLWEVAVEIATADDLRREALVRAHAAPRSKEKKPAKKPAAKPKPVIKKSAPKKKAVHQALASTSKLGALLNTIKAGLEAEQTIDKLRNAIVDGRTARRKVKEMGLPLKIRGTHVSIVIEK